MQREPLFVGYCNGRGLADITAEQARKLTHLNIAFGTLKDGLINIEGIEESLQYLGQIRMHNPKLNILLSTGGGGPYQRLTHGIATRTDEGLVNFITSVMEVVRKYDLDGVDCDWEFPCFGGDWNEKYRFTALLKEYRAVLNAYAQEKGRKMWLTIAADCRSPYVNNVELEKIQEYLDFINLMTYDIHSGYNDITGHHSNLYPPKAEMKYHLVEGDGPWWESMGVDREFGSVDRYVKNYIAHGVPKEKIVVGAAFYSRRWNGVKAVENGFNQTAQTKCLYGPDYTAIHLLYERSTEYVKYWDDDAKAPYLFNGDSFITYDDPQSIACKCKYVLEEGLGGMMYWVHDADKTGILFNAIYDALILK